ncbi:MAG: DUF5107 domain-containing protein [Clostridia bacterium]|nr:DUF5107 domain-containing protein [Clostridia bacterium]
MSTLMIAPYWMPGASLGKENPLPDLKGVGDAHEHIEIDHETVTDEEARYMGWGRIHSILPYTIQDGYGRARRRRSFPAAILENEHLKAVFILNLGGRLWSLYDKDKGRELLHRNPVFQPANLALRNAWFSGGVEWNCGIIGHTPFTADDLCAETLSLSDGTPVLRMFQYERVRHLLYRVEAFLPDGAKELYVRVRIDNARQEDTAVYWWSNMAVDEREDVRVLVPAQKAFRYGYGGKLSKVPVPYMTVEADKLRGDAARLARKNGGTLDWDISHTTGLPQAMDFFFDVPKTARPFIAALNKDGYGMCQTSTGELRGRKLFVWGMGRGGRHWQSFLSKPGSAYIELQSGLAHTQLEHLPMAAGASISWLESYGPIQADAAAAQDADWDKAVSAAAKALDTQRPGEALEKYHDQIKRELDGAAGRVVHRGMGFARAEKALLGDAFDLCGLPLAAMRRGKAEIPWLSLAQKGMFPCPAPLEEPVSYQIGPEWESALRKAVASGGSDHWYAHYQLGVMAAHQNEWTEAQKEFELSLSQAENPWAMRCLSLCASQAGNQEAAANWMLEAATMKPIRPLTVEAMELLLNAQRFEDMLSLYAHLSPALQKDGRLMAYHAAALLRLGRLNEAEKVLQGPIVLTDVREGNNLLTDLWFEAAALRQFGKADEAARAWAEEHVPVPEHLDFRMR